MLFAIDSSSLQTGDMKVPHDVKVIVAQSQLEIIQLSRHVRRVDHQMSTDQLTDRLITDQLSDQPMEMTFYGTGKKQGW